MDSMIPEMGGKDLWMARPGGRVPPPRQVPRPTSSYFGGARAQGSQVFQISARAILATLAATTTATTATTATAATTTTDDDDDGGGDDGDAGGGDDYDEEEDEDAVAKLISHSKKDKGYRLLLGRKSVFLHRPSTLVGKQRGLIRTVGGV